MKYSVKMKVKDVKADYLVLSEIIWLHHLSKVVNLYSNLYQIVFLIWLIYSVIRIRNLRQDGLEMISLVERLKSSILYQVVLLKVLVVLVEQWQNHLDFSVKMVLVVHLLLVELEKVQKSVRLLEKEWFSEQNIS